MESHIKTREALDTQMNTQNLYHPIEKVKYTPIHFEKNPYIPITLYPR